VEVGAGSYPIAREHEEFLARVRAWGEQTAPSSRPAVRFRISPLRRLALAVTTVSTAAAAAVVATPLDDWSRGWSFGFASFGAGTVAGTIAVRLGSRRPTLAAATAATFCFGAMFVALVVTTVRV
jgi:hypothetical protein